jgi:hypothetical protein
MCLSCDRQKTFVKLFINCKYIMMPKFSLLLTNSYFNVKHVVKYKHFRTYIS